MIEDKKLYYIIGLFVLYVVIICLLSSCGNSADNDRLQYPSQKIENYGKVL